MMSFKLAVKSTGVGSNTRMDGPRERSQQTTHVLLLATTREARDHTHTPTTHVARRRRKRRGMADGRPPVDIVVSLSRQLAVVDTWKS